MMQRFGAKVRERIRLRLSKGRMVVSSTQEAMTQDAPPEGLKSWNIYQSAKDCPLEAMIAIMCHDDYTLLFKQGQNHDADPHSMELHQAWQSIYCEYLDIAGGAEIGAMVARTKQMTLISAKIERVERLLAFAGSYRHEGICEELQAEGFNVQYEAADAIYISQLKAAQSRLKADVMRLNALIADEPKKKATGKQEKPTEAQFENTLQELSKMQGYEVKRDITVLTYATLIKRLRAQIEALKPKPKPSKR